LLKVVLLVYSHGLSASRKIEQAGRENVTCMALACAMVPDHRPLAALVASMKDAMVSLLRALLLVCAEQG
jgi:hypothetical protein